MNASRRLETCWVLGMAAAARTRLAPAGALPRAAAAAFARYFCARAPRLGQADRDRLLAARHLLARAPAPERAVLPLVHHTLHFSLRLASLLGHRASPLFVLSRAVPTDPKS